MEKNHFFSCEKLCFFLFVKHMDDLDSLPHVPENAPPDSGKAEPFINMKPFIRNVFCWLLNWDAHYFLPIASTWVDPDSTNWVTRFYLKCPF